MSQKSPHPIDKHVGTRIRLRRALLEMTQQRLADAAGITFQQIQKYEKGANRVSASRLQHLASILGVTVGFFYEGVSEGPDSKGGADPQARLLTEISGSPEGARLINNFVRISDPVMRRRLAELAEAIADGMAAPSGEPAAEQPQRRSRAE